jgi:hypothetical protein
VLLLLRIVCPVTRHCCHQLQGRTLTLIATVNWADNQWRARQGETVIDNHVVVPIMQTIVTVMPITGMIVVIGDSNGKGGGGNDGGANGGPDGDDGSAAIAMQ